MDKMVRGVVGMLAWVCLERGVDGGSGQGVEWRRRDGGIGGWVTIEMR